MESKQTDFEQAILDGTSSIVRKCSIASVRGHAEVDQKRIRNALLFLCFYGSIFRPLKNSRATQTKKTKIHTHTYTHTHKTHAKRKKTRTKHARQKIHRNHRKMPIHTILVCRINSISALLFPCHPSPLVPRGSPAVVTLLAHMRSLAFLLRLPPSSARPFLPRIAL